MSAYPAPTQIIPIYNPINWNVVDNTYKYQTPWITNQNLNGYSAYTPSGSAQSFTLNPDANLNLQTNTGATIVSVGGVEKARVDSTGLSAGTISSTTLNTNTISTGTISATSISASNLFNFLYLPSNVSDTFPKLFNNTVINPTNGRVYFTYFFNLNLKTINQLGIGVNSVGQDVGGTTVRRLALFTVNSTNGSILTKVAQTANQSVIGSVSGVSSYPLDATGGFVSTYDLQPNTQYVLAMILYNTGGTYTPPQVYVNSMGGSLLASVSNKTSYIVDTQTDILNSYTLVSGNQHNFTVWGRLQ